MSKRPKSDGEQRVVGKRERDSKKRCFTSGTPSCVHLPSSGGKPGLCNSEKSEDIPAYSTAGMSS